MIPVMQILVMKIAMIAVMLIGGGDSLDGGGADNDDSYEY